MGCSVVVLTWLKEDLERPTNRALRHLLRAVCEDASGSGYEPCEDSGHHEIRPSCWCDFRACHCRSQCLTNPFFGPAVGTSFEVHAEDYPVLQ